VHALLTVDCLQIAPVEATVGSCATHLFDKSLTHASGLPIEFFIFFKCLLIMIAIYLLGYSRGIGNHDFRMISQVMNCIELPERNENSG